MPNRSDRIVAIMPVRDASNSFVGLFSDAVASQGYGVRNFDWVAAASGKIDAAILHWPYELIGFGGLAGVRRCLVAYWRLGKARRRGVRFIWVAHNAEPHDGGLFAPFLMRRFIGSLDAMIHLSAYSHALVDRLYAPGSSVEQLETVHGHYRDTMKTSPLSAPPIERMVRLAYFGQVRAYKNVESLARLATQLPEEISLTVSGRRSHEHVAVELETIAAGATNVHLDIRPEALPDEAIERCVDEAHAVVLPYQAVLNSGAAIFALSRARPVLAPNTGSLPELQAAVGEDWLQLYDGELDLTIVRNFAHWLRQRPSLEHPDLSAYGWDRVGADIGGLLDRVLAGRVASKTALG